MSKLKWIGTVLAMAVAVFALDRGGAARRQGAVQAGEYLRQTQYIATVNPADDPAVCRPASAVNGPAGYRVPGPHPQGPVAALGPKHDPLPVPTPNSPVAPVRAAWHF